MCMCVSVHGHVHVFVSASLWVCPCLCILMCDMFGTLALSQPNNPEFPLRSDAGSAICPPPWRFYKALRGALKNLRAMYVYICLCGYHVYLLMCE